MKIGQKRWQLYPSNRDLSSKIGQQLSISPVIGQILLNRGIRSLTDAKVFLSPDSQHETTFSDDILAPFYHVLGNAIEHKKRIFVYGDYDVDGVTSTAFMVDVLNRLGCNVTYMIPNRFADGYGMSQRGVDTICAHQTDLLITLDCGISNFKEISEVKDRCGADIIILDHHKIPTNLPPADAIVDPQVLDPAHPLFGLCTVGIVYVVLDAANKHFSWGVDLSQYLDLVATGTIADVAALSGENRRLTALGLRHLSRSPRPGIKAILDVAEFKKPAVTPRDVGFLIAPRINAAGRLGDAKIAVELMMEEDLEKASTVARKLQRINDDRRFLGDTLLEQATAQIEADPYLDQRKALVAYGDGWHAGVIGIAAARLSEKYGRPVILIAQEGEIARGSARSIGDVSIYLHLKACEAHFNTFGGHTQAAGFSMSPSEITPFIHAFYTHCEAHIDDRDLLPILDLDCQLDDGDLNLELASALDGLEPFGQSNPAPLFYSNTLRAVDFKTVGDGSHLKATFSSLDGKTVIDGIGFGLADKLPHLYKASVELAFHLDINEWQGRKSAQLHLVDIKS